MFKFEKISSFFNCQFCQSILKDPIILPCGESVCQVHTEEICESECSFCSEKHQSPEHGFPINKFAQNQLQFGLNMTNLNFNQFIHCKKTVDGLNKDLKEVEVLRNDPENYISDYFDELTRQVDIRRETLLKEIHQYSDELIQKITKLKQDCFANSKNPSITTKSIDEINTKLTNLNIMLNSLEVGDKQHNEIMSQNLTKEIARLMQPILKQYKFELHGKKSYAFKQVENISVSIENIFGKLNDFDYDIENPDINRGVASIPSGGNRFNFRNQ